MPGGLAGRTAVVTTSFPRHADDAAGHFVASEIAEQDGAEIAVFAPAPAPWREMRDFDGRAATIHWLAGGEAFGWPGLAARLAQDPTRIVSATRFVQAARSALQAYRPDHVVAHWALPSAWPIAPTGARLTIVSHGGDVRLLARMPAVLRARLVTQLLDRASTWRFVSESLLAELTCTLPASLAARVEARASIKPPTVRCRVDDAHAALLRASVANGPMFVSVGRLVATKRVDRIVRHVAQSPEATLVVVGDGPERAALQALAAQGQLRAHFVGERPRSEALAWIRAADWLCHASEAEGASCVLTEALALGTPVLTL